MVSVTSTFPNEMRAVLHKDRVQVRIARNDYRGRPEGRVVEIVERPDQPIIGRFLQESGVCLLHPKTNATVRTS